MDNLEAGRLGVLVAGRDKYVAKCAVLGFEVAHNFLEVVEVCHERWVDPSFTMDVDVATVVEGTDVGDERAVEDLEVDFGVLEDELVRAVDIELVGERGVGEVALLVVDAANALVEELPNRLLADPIVVVGIDGTVCGETPVVTVEISTNESATEVLVRCDAALDRAHTSLGQFVGLGVAEAEEGVVMLAKDCADGFFDGGTELGRFLGEDGVVRRRNDHVGPLVVKHTAVLVGKVVTYNLEALNRERADVGGNAGHCVESGSNGNRKRGSTLGLFLIVSILQ